MKENPPELVTSEALPGEDEDAPSPKDVYIYLVILVGLMLVAGLS